ncbi:DUF1707 domain-containing protein [Streptosporangium sp. NBC_01639]|uniref:DUF1707 SHOCT-like domain-containing protein n=1 Tax=unclassified Streptosporangium TaxID=2632669 RepID=UPI002DDA746F|nr:DUF1707 domain-containing protein [Streptosporangium sp. NBC_01756]WSC89808.1 DUF1707 domain-containing protein [Streptosporangium sp. NBC_01756]WTD51563.1 DUF1707 domain-containing protein [Streptosporangium sp. NBC_01639]
MTPADLPLPSRYAPALRASDADRDRVASVLAEALATGRLTSLEHADRLQATYDSVTVDQLAPITADLPDVTVTGNGPATVRQEVSAVFSKVVRGGRWIAGRHTTLNATFGALIVDLSDAVLPGREITLEVNSYCGKLIVRVPGNAHVIDEVGALFAKRHISGGLGDESGPVIRVIGRVTFGKVVVARERSDWNLPDKP